MLGGDVPDERETPSPKKTIVGGRPPEAATATPPVPTGIQRLLRLAAVDEAFRRTLLDRRGDVAAAAGVTLTATERAVLAAIPERQILAMATNLPPPDPARREFLRATAASAVVLLGGALLADCSGGCVVRGMQSDVPPPAPVPPEPPPPRPDENLMQSEGGIAPDEPPPRPDENLMQSLGGIAPDEPPPPRPDESLMQRTGGARPDEPPPPPRPIDRTTQTGGGARPDVPPRK